MSNLIEKFELEPNFIVDELDFEPEPYDFACNGHHITIAELILVIYFMLPIMLTAIYSH
jgi:hypothetical protein